MKTGSYIEKIPGGKLLRMTASFRGETIVSVSLRGDFFVHPEESIGLLETDLAGRPLSTAHSAIASALKDAELYGISGDDILRALKACHAQTQVH